MAFDFLLGLVSLFFPRMRVSYEEPLRFPSVLICNHLGSFGPLAMILYFRGSRYRPWVTYRSLSRAHVASELEGNLFSPERKVPRRLKRMIARLLGPLVVWIMRQARAIPVYDDAVNYGETQRLTQQALGEGCCIVIFADRSRDHFGEDMGGGVSPGFVPQAYSYRKRTGKALPVYPVHVSRKHQEIRVGKMVTYDVSRPLRDLEREMAEAVGERMRKLSGDG